MSISLARFLAVAIAAAGVVAALAADVRASPSVHSGDLDMSFGADGSGRVGFNFGGNWDAGTRIIIQFDGKYLVAGHGLDQSGGAIGPAWGIGFLARYLPDGTPDASFNGTGRRVFGDRMLGNVLNDLLLQRDGKIMVVALRCCVGYGYASGVIMRLNAEPQQRRQFRRWRGAPGQRQRCRAATLSGSDRDASRRTPSRGRQ